MLKTVSGQTYDSEPGRGLGFESNSTYNNYNKIIISSSGKNHGIKQERYQVGTWFDSCTSGFKHVFPVSCMCFRF